MATARPGGKGLGICFGAGYAVAAAVEDPAHSTTDRAAAMFDVGLNADPRRGSIPQWTNAFAVVSWPGWTDSDAVALAPKTEVPCGSYTATGRPCMRYNARGLHAGAAGPKALYRMHGRHTDVSDKPAGVGEAADAAAGHSSS